ncbi:MAG: T9SS type A sorting domain-containing protein [Saprospiraceae bacterium]|nr:T9SS type A sorting domain-containing protein [Saprospiraceae bacterium]
MKTILRITAVSAALVATLAGALYYNNCSEWYENEEEEGNREAIIEGRYQQEFLMTRDPHTNTIPRTRLLTAQRIADQKRAQMGMQEDQIPIYWNERGPNNVGGRTRGLIIDANDPTGQTVWAAGVAGGLWRTTNIDAPSPVWTPLNDLLENMAITTLAQSPANPNIMYFGTGEETLNFGDPVRGLGIWRTTDGGANWAQLPDAFNNVFKIVVANNGWVYAGTDAGLWRSTDGINFQAVPQVVGVIHDVEIAANGDVYACRQGTGVFRLQAGAWMQLSSPNFPTMAFGRVELACAPSNGQVAYVAFNVGGGCSNLCQTTDGGATWTARTSPPAYGGQAWYNFAFSVDPNNTNRIWVGGQGLSVSSDGGTNWNSVNNIHADHHTVLYRAGSSTEVVCGNDGGVYRCLNADNANPTMINKNTGYNVTQFYSVALHPNSGSNYMLGGTQDNGTPRFNAAGISSTVDVSGGDGCYCFIDQDNPNIQIVSYVNRWFDLSTDGGGSFAQNFFGNNPNAMFVTPAEYDDAANILYSSDGPDTLARVSDIGGANTLNRIRITQFGNGRASAIAVSPTNANRIFIGTDGGRMVRIDNAQNNAPSFTVTQLTQPVNGYISCIEIEPGNDNHLIVTCSNYGLNSVLESTNGGTTWVDLDNDLPDMPVRWALFNPYNHDQLMLATELGVWSTDDLDGVNTEWWPTNTFGLANCRIDMLQYRSSDHLVAAATHGRGMYTTDYFTLLNTCVPSLFVGGAIPSGLYMAEDFIESNGTLSPGAKAIFQAGDYVDLKNGFWAQQGSDFWALIRECNLTPAPNPLAPNLVEQRRSEDSGRLQQPAIGQPTMACFPNPATYRLSVQGNLPEAGAYSMYVRNLQGKLIRQIAVNEWMSEGPFNVEIDASTFDPGMYILTLQTKKQAITQRFVVAR